MKALRKITSGDAELAVEEVSAPGTAPSGHVVVRVLAAGICGTDLHIQRDEFPSCPPVTMGHEIGGVVHSVGEGVDAAWAGRRVAAETYFFTCGVCAWCRAGQTNLCPRRHSLGSHVDGGFAEYVVMPAVNLRAVPDELPDVAIPLMEPLACVCNNLCDPPVIDPGDRVLVMGPGTMGIIAAQVARACGADVLLTGIAADAARLEVAEGIGVPTAHPEGELISLSLGGDGFDAVVDCSGAGPAIAAGLRAVRKGGSYVQIGLAGGDVSLPINEICYREISVRSGFASTPTSWERALRLVEQRRVRLDPLVSESVPLSDWQRAFERTARGDGVKFVLDPSR
jgi:L-iditol 2-dehydrogenase